MRQRLLAQTKRLASLGLIALSASTAALATPALLNVSFDASRGFYKDYNQLFKNYWQQKTGEVINLRQSHGGSSKQALSVINGLPADIVTMNQSADIDIIVKKSQAIKNNWAQRFPNQSVPFTSVTVFLVRKGNPKNIRNWADLAKPNVSVILSNPKTSGNGRYTYLSAWAYAVHQGQSPSQITAFMTKLYRNAPILETGSRAATTTFTQRQMGDVLVTFENEAAMAAHLFKNDQYQIIYPSVSILVEPPVALVDKVTHKHQSSTEAEAYLRYLWSPSAQTLAAKHFWRPQDSAIRQQFAKQFPSIITYTVQDTFGSWRNLMKTHFGQQGVFDQIYASILQG